MVTDDVSVALDLISLVALTMPVVAILSQVMLNFSDETEEAWRGSTEGPHLWLVERRFDFMLYSLIALFAAMSSSLYYVFQSMDLPWPVQLSIYSIMGGFALLLIGASGLSYQLAERFVE